MQQVRRLVQVSMLIGLATLLTWSVGCGPSKPPTGSISGTVTCNGQAVTPGAILFVNTNAGLGANSELDASGSYRIPSLQVGEYQVAITRPLAPPPGEVAAGKPIILTVNCPKKFTDPKTSDLTATVEEGENTIDFNL